MSKQYGSKSKRGGGITAVMLILTLALVLVVFWEPLRNNSLVMMLHELTRSKALNYLFRAFTFIGDDEGHLILVMVVYWCVNKSLGFRAVMVLLFSGIYTYLLKEAFALPRPAVPGVEPPDSRSFPSGHTLNVLSVWGYLAVRLRRKAFWICAFAVLLLVGLSRMVLGVHFPGDVLGGLLFGLLFLTLALGAGALLHQAGLPPSIPFPVLLGGLAALFAVVAVLVVRCLPGEDPLKVAGFMAGACLGQILENRYVHFSPRGCWLGHVLKVAAGLAMLYLIVHPLQALLPPGAPWSLARYGLAGLWATCLAPLFFVLIGLAAREPRIRLPRMGPLT